MFSAARRIKRLYFESLRKNRLTRTIQDLDNYLTNVEILSGLPSAKNALVLSPHPDDESIGCGGALALLSQAGTQVDVAFLSSGAVSGDLKTAARREDEARAAAKVLGLHELHFLRGQDGDLHLQPWLSDSVQALLEKKTYSLLFCPWPLDGQSDHAAAFRIFRNALRRANLVAEVWLYEVWAPLLANRVVNIDSVIEVKRQAIDSHASQVSNINYTEKFLALAAYRSLICRPGNYAEAFFACNGALLESLVP